VTTWFQEFDTNGSGVLERGQLGELLTALAPDSPPDEQALDLLMKKAVEVDLNGDGIPDTAGISRSSVLKVVAKYKAYAKEQRFIDDVFDKCVVAKARASEAGPEESGRAVRSAHPPSLSLSLSLCFRARRFDENKSGVLEADQLLKLMQEISPTSNPEQGDADFILGEVDKSETNSITREEVLPALATWKHLAEAKAQKSGFCCVS